MRCKYSTKTECFLNSTITKEVIFFFIRLVICFSNRFSKFPIDGTHFLPPKNRTITHKNENNTSHEIHIVYTF